MPASAKEYLKLTAIFLCQLASLTVIINRGLHGEYNIGIHSFNISFLLLFPTFIVFTLRQGRLLSSKYRSCLVAIILSIPLVMYYLSSNGLWCMQHPKVIPAMCEKLNLFSDFAKSSNLTSWWLTFGDLLAIERGFDMPLPWEHDIDICITSDQYSIFLKAINSEPSIFQATPEFQKEGHWYLPIDMSKLGLLSTTKRTAEGVNIDVWTCPKLSGNITQVWYCNGIMNIPQSKTERQSLLKQLYGDVSVVKFAHHSWMCRIWMG